jgi:hypothetical protein
MDGGAVNGADGTFHLLDVLENEEHWVLASRRYANRQAQVFH